MPQDEVSSNTQLVSMYYAMKRAKHATSAAALGKFGVIPRNVPY